MDPIAHEALTRIAVSLESISKSLETVEAYLERQDKTLVYRHVLDQLKEGKEVRICQQVET